MCRELDKLRSLHMQESYGSDLLAVCSLVELMVAINQSAADRACRARFRPIWRLTGWWTGY